MNLKIQNNKQVQSIVDSHREDNFWMTASSSIDYVAESILKEVEIFEKNAGKLPSGKNIDKSRSIDAIWVISGSGSYLSPITDSPIDVKMAQVSWYPGQDRARLDYALNYLDRLEALSDAKPILVYNGTKKQNEDLLEAIEDGSYKFEESRLHIPHGEISRTIDQVKKFSLPEKISNNPVLAVLSNSAHLPRILRFMKKFPKSFKGMQIKVLSLNVRNEAEQKDMVQAELNNLLGYIERGEADIKSYPFQ